MENEDQLEWFKKIVDVHQKDYVNYSIQNKLGVSASGYAGQQQAGDVEMNEDGNPQDLNQTESESKKLKKLFDAFDLDSYWRNGLEVEAGNDDGDIITGDHQFKDNTYNHKVHRIQ